MKKILYLFLGCFFMAGCYDEDELSPSEEPELIYGKYTLPQGDHDYDKDIVDLYKKSGTLVLYKFSSKDFGWSVTGNSAWDAAKDTVLLAGQEDKYDAVPADENYVGQQLELITGKLLEHLSDPMMQFLPQKMLLCSVLDKVPVGLGYNPRPEQRVALNVYSGFYHIAVNWGNAEILNMDAGQRNSFKNELCTAYMKGAAKLMKKPEAFFMVTHYDEQMQKDAIYANGILDHQHRTDMEKDWMDYLVLAATCPLQELEAAGGVLHPSVDVNGKVREKYLIMTGFLKEKYGFDIQAMGDDKE